MASCLFMAGCGTTIVRVMEPAAGAIGGGGGRSQYEPALYPGVAFDAKACWGSLKEKESDLAEKSAFLIFFGLDMPLSFCADTLLLPVDIYILVQGD